MKEYTYIYKQSLRVLIFGLATVGFCLVTSAGYSQTQSNNQQSQYIAPKTKQDIANERAQKKNSSSQETDSAIEYEKHRNVVNATGKKEEKIWMDNMYTEGLESKKAIPAPVKGKAQDQNTNLIKEQEDQ